MRIWLHIGAGSFHRAHQAWYMHRLRQSGDAEWGIALANVRDDVTPMLERLAAQGNRYTLETVDPAGNRQYELIQSIVRIVPWDRELDALAAAGADADARVVSFTVTEAGYYLDNDLKLDRNNPDVKADLAGGKTTIYGAIEAVLRRRSAVGGGELTLLCCDNVRHNGARFRSGMIQYLEQRRDQSLLDWFSAHTRCPCSMVDRITPRPTPDIAPRARAATGFDDQVPVMSESFVQWVVEDDFAAGRPALETVGVEMVKDVQPYEEAKIRILNSSHAAVAWAGTLAGKRYIHESVLTPFIHAIAHDYITRDVIPCLAPSPLDLAAYRDTVLERYQNANILDTNQRVAADGFAKIPAMILPTLAESLAAGRRPLATAMLPGLFFLYLEQWHKGRLPYEYQDGVMDPEKAHAFFTRDDPLAAYGRDGELFGALAGTNELATLLTEAVERLRGNFIC